MDWDDGSATPAAADLDQEPFHGAVEAGVFLVFLVLYGCPAYFLLRSVVLLSRVPALIAAVVVGAVVYVGVRSHERSITHASSNGPHKSSAADPVESDAS